jgi:hypothetical protein
LFGNGLALNVFALDEWKCLSRVKAGVGTDSFDVVFEVLFIYLDGGKVRPIE